jgi:hypothetical protein
MNLHFFCRIPFLLVRVGLSFILPMFREDRNGTVDRPISKIERVLSADLIAVYCGMKDPEPVHKPLPRFHLVEQRTWEARVVITSRTAIIALGIGGFLFLGAGIALFIIMKQLLAVKIRYDDACENETDCILTMRVPKRMSGKIEFRYELSGFYQNHRRYVLSKSQPQLQGEYVDFEGMANCVPYRSLKASVDQEDWVLPCGVFPMSVFNDTFVWLKNPSLFAQSGIAFQGDRELAQPLSGAYHSGHKWLEAEDSVFQGQTDEHFVVWMRASFLSTAQKTYAQCKDCVIEPGEYEIEVTNRYPAGKLGTKKYITLVTVSTLGTRKKFLGIAYIVTGVLCLVLSGAFMLGELFKPRQFGEAPPRGRVGHN